MSLTIGLVRIMNPIIAIMLVVTIMRMANIMAISRQIEAMNRPMNILAIEIPITIIITNMHRNQQKSHKNTSIKYTNRRKTTQIP